MEDSLVRQIDLRPLKQYHVLAAFTAFDLLHVFKTNFSLATLDPSL
jgi:hypothetical protein